ncbi:MAG TPA: redoxin domain-containing protein [Longimicrobiales bacterium]|nr:redoxin domain-containing protein [Longimicrobiales bacterium]
MSVGDQAPDFSLPFEPSPERVTLSAFRGEKNVVLLFFPLAFSSVCTDEVCRMAEDYSRWTGLDAEVLAVSVDSPFVAQRFARETGAPFPVLSDFNKEAVRAWDVMYEDYFGLRGVAKRAAFVVDREGVVRYAWVTEDSGELPDFGAIQEAVRALG